MSWIWKSTAIYHWYCIWPLEMQQINDKIGLIRLKLKKNQILRT